MTDEGKFVEVSTEGDTIRLEIIRTEMLPASEQETLEYVDLDVVEVIALISDLAGEVAKTDLHRKVRDFIHREAEDLFDDLG